MKFKLNLFYTFNSSEWRSKVYITLTEGLTLLKYCNRKDFDLKYINNKNEKNFRKIYLQSLKKVQRTLKSIDSHWHILFRYIPPFVLINRIADSIHFSTIKDLEKFTNLIQRIHRMVEKGEYDRFDFTTTHQYNQSSILPSMKCYSFVFYKYGDSQSILFYNKKEILDRTQNKRITSIKKLREIITD